MDIEGMNLYFLYTNSIPNGKYSMKTLSGKTFPFFQDKWHKKHQIFYWWHSRGGILVASDFEYLYSLRDEFGDEVDFWFVNLTGAWQRVKKETRKAKGLAKICMFETDSILLDVDEEVAVTFDLNNLSGMAFVKKDNYVFKKLEGKFDKELIRQTISDMIKAPLHHDWV